MCLTVPAQIIELDGTVATVKDSTGIKKIQITLIPDLKVGDWILYIDNFAVEKVDKHEAGEILELLSAPDQQIDNSLLSEKFKTIIKDSKLRTLTKEEIIYLLETQNIEEAALVAEANLVRKTNIKDFICIHGIIEFSNWCTNDCAYCGLREANKTIGRYRMTIDEIVKTAVEAVNITGYKLLVLQSGDDPFYTDDMLVEIIEKIKAECRVFILVSVGERGYDCYKRLKEVGVSGALLRFETTNPILFQKMHGVGKKLTNRMQHLKFLRELGYFVATGSIVGLPGQTIEDVADDVLTTKQLAHMVSTGPFVPCDETPLVNLPQGSVDLCFKSIAIYRLMLKSTRIPVATALETIAGEDGRKKALQAGANSLMFNITPEKYRPLYKIYPNKFFQEKTIWQKYGLFKYEESYKMLEERMIKEITKYVTD